MAIDSQEVLHPRRSFTLLILANSLWIFGITLYLGFIGLYLTQLGANPVEVGSWSTIFSLSSLIFVGLGGPLTARFGEKPILLLGWIGILPAPLIYIIAPSWHWSLIGAFFEGLAFVAGAPAASYISLLSKGSKRGRAYTTFSASSAAGSILAPLIGGWLIVTSGYSLTFLLAALLFGVSSTLLLPISSVSKTNEITNKLHSRSYLKNRVFLLSTSIWFVIGAAWLMTNIFVPVYLNYRFGLIEANIGELSSIMSAFGAILGPLMGQLGDRWSYTKALIFPIIGTLGFFGLLVINPSLFLLPYIYGFGGLIYGLYGLLSAVISHHIAKEQLASAFATFNFVSRILNPFTPLIGGFAYNINPFLPLSLSSLILPIPLSLLFLLHRVQVKSHMKISSKIG